MPFFKRIEAIKAFQTMSRIHILPVKYGDSFVIECNKEGNRGIVVIDGGPTGCGYELFEIINEIGTPDLMVLTHYDDDHIGGLLQYLDSCRDESRVPAKEIWANCAGYVELAAQKTTSAKQGVRLSVLLDEMARTRAMIWRDDIEEGFICNYPFACIEVVSPTNDVRHFVIEKQEQEGRKMLKAEPKSNDDLEMPLDKLAAHKPDKPNLCKQNELANASSISLILSCDGLTFLLLGDSYPQNVEAYLRNKGFSEDYPLIVDYVKVSHHGSKNNTSNELLNIVKCNNYIISTDGGNGSSNHPDRIALAHILCHSKRDRTETVHLFFNHKLDVIESNGTPFFNEDEDKEWNFVIHDNTTELWF